MRSEYCICNSANTNFAAFFETARISWYRKQINFNLTAEMLVISAL